MKQNDFAMKNKDSSFCIFAFMVILLAAQVLAAELVNPFLQEGQWYKAALHVHSTTSDGDVIVPERMKQYRDKVITWWPSQTTGKPIISMDCRTIPSL